MEDNNDFSSSEEELEEYKPEPLLKSKNTARPKGRPLKSEEEKAATKKAYRERVNAKRREMTKLKREDEKKKDFKARLEKYECESEEQYFREEEKFQMRLEEYLSYEEEKREAAKQQKLEVEERKLARLAAKEAREEAARLKKELAEKELAEKAAAEPEPEPAAEAPPKVITKQPNTPVKTDLRKKKTRTFQPPVYESTSFIYCD